MLQVVCEASPQHFHLHLCRAPHMELAQPQLALDPCVTKLHDSSPATISLLSFFTSHLLAERDHHRALFELRHRTAVIFVVWTTLRFASAGFAILEQGFVDVVHHPVPHLAFSLPMQDFALRARRRGRSTRCSPETLPRVGEHMLALGAGYEVMVLAEMFQFAGRNFVMALRALAK
jgi:hypothetical protein